MSTVVFSYDRKMKFLCSLFPTADKKTIEEIWKKNNYNMTETTTELQEHYSPMLSPSDSPVPKNTTEDDVKNTSRKSTEEERKVPDTIILDCKIKMNNCLEISYFIPQEQLTENTFIALYDRFETDPKQYVNCAFCHGKTSAFVHFDNLKEGKYTVKIYPNDQGKEIISEDIIIGSEIKMDYLLSSKGKKRKIILTVENNDTPYWIGIYTQSVDIRNNETYLMSSNFTKEKTLTLDISSLKSGSYECRIFTKHSTEGLFFKKYHSLGECSFTLL